MSGHQQVRTRVSKKIAEGERVKVYEKVLSKSA